MPRTYVTLDDVAREAGLSRAQVSRALRDGQGVLPETRAHVAEVAARIGYTPNIVARSLASARSRNVGVLIGEPLNPFHMQLAQAVDGALAAADFDAVVALRVRDARAALSEVERLRALRVAGLILISVPHEIALLRQVAAQLPCVYIGALPEEVAQLATVQGRDAEAVAALIAHLVALGHRRIGHIGGAAEPGAAERRAAYRAAMAAAGLAPIEVAGRHDIDAGRDGAEALMALPAPPTAIFADNDVMAIGVMSQLATLGLRVPEDVSVAGFDDIPFAASAALSLTTLRQDPEAQGRAAVAALRARLADPAAPPQHHALPLELRLRRSVAPPPGR